jgi:hypothetical protein
MKFRKINSLIFISSIFLFLFLINISAEITFFDEPQNSFVVASIETATSSGDGGILGSVGRWFSKKVECKNDSDCGTEKYCNNSKCYEYECSSNIECETEETCWKNKCTKISGTTISVSRDISKENIILSAIVLCVLFFIMYIRKRKNLITRMRSTNSFYIRLKQFSNFFKVR